MGSKKLYDYIWGDLFHDATPQRFQHARRLRIQNNTAAEVLLWEQLRNRKLCNCKFRRQHPIADYIADFYCAEKKLVIEVDGVHHLTELMKCSDQSRSDKLQAYNIKVIRFSNEEVMNNINRVLEKIIEELR